jgi:hypothetical protein
LGLAAVLNKRSVAAIMQYNVTASRCRTELRRQNHRHAEKEDEEGIEKRPILAKRQLPPLMMSSPWTLRDDCVTQCRRRRAGRWSCVSSDALFSTKTTGTNLERNQQAALDLCASRRCW